VSDEVAQLSFHKELPSVVFDECGDLLRLHFDEVEKNKDIKLNPDNEFYKSIDDCSALFTVRCGDDLVGYNLFFLKRNAHQCHSMQANQDVIFIRKDKRGQGREFISWCDNQLKNIGVQVVYYHVPLSNNWGKMLEGIGYEPHEIMYSKRLDNG
jgi:hypothetical protein